MDIDFTPLLRLQKALDEDIANRHGVNYQKTFDRRVLALFVELGELANATRCFKYWSNKPPENRAVVLDEYADGLHFLLSLAVMLGINECSYKGPSFAPYGDQSKGFLDVYSRYLDLYRSFDKEHWKKAMEGYISLLFSFGFTIEEAVEAYKGKMEVNLDRQREGY